MSQDFLLPLAGALCQCVLLILLGFVCQSLGFFSKADTQGLSRFVGRLALPGMLYLSMATLDLSQVGWKLVGTICIAKAVRAPFIRGHMVRKLYMRAACPRRWLRSSWS